MKNENEWLSFRNPYVTSQALSETVSRPPDNQYYKIKFTGSLRLPMNTNLIVNAGYSRMTSDVSLLDTIWTSTSAPTYTLTTLGLNDRKFNGDIRYKDFSLTATSNPITPLNLKAYFKFTDKDNKSDEITYTSGAFAVSNDLFEYKKTSAGISADYKFLPNLKGSAGYDYTNIDRERFDIPETTDNKFTVQIKYSPLDFLDARIKYQRLERDGNHDAPSEELIAENTAFYIENFLRRFDAASKKQDSIKISIDLMPIEGLDITFEYAYKRDKYDKTTLGMNRYKRDEFIVDSSYDFKFARLYGYFDYEKVRTEQTSRAIGSDVTNVISYDPNQPPAASNYNWDVLLKEANFAWGIGTEVPLMSKKLVLTLQYDYEKSNGNADFTSETLVSPLTQDNIDISSYDDYRQQRLSAKLKYSFRKNLKFILGYYYDRYKYSDAEYDGYTNVITSSGNPNSYLTGAYNNDSYRANVVYLMTVYKF